MRRLYRSSLKPYLVSRSCQTVHDIQSFQARGRVRAKPKTPAGKSAGAAVVRAAAKTRCQTEESEKGEAARACRDRRSCFRRFHEATPEPKGELEHVNPFTLLVAVVLSAQATDAASTRRRVPCSRPPIRLRRWPHWGGARAGVCQVHRSPSGQRPRTSSGSRKFSSKGTAESGASGSGSPRAIAGGGARKTPTWS